MAKCRQWCKLLAFMCIYLCVSGYLTTAVFGFCECVLVFLHINECAYVWVPHRELVCFNFFIVLYCINGVLKMLICLHSGVCVYVCLTLYKCNQRNCNLAEKDVRPRIFQVSSSSSYFFSLDGRSYIFFVKLQWEMSLTSLLWVKYVRKPY